MTFTVHPIDILHVNDNYVWAITPSAGRKTYVVDPGEAPAVLNWLAERQRELAGILITHRHWDHVNGIDGLLERFSVPVWGPALANLPQVSQIVGEDDVIPLEGITLQVMAVPGHTRDHIAYYSETGETPALFCGDTLFACGCGRVFDGSVDDLHRSLCRFATLPKHTRVYCAHEYTAANLAFARTVEPDNEAMRERQAQVAELRARGLPTLPTELGLELQTNPFLRCELPKVKEKVQQQAGCELASPSEVFAALRRWKDNF